MCNKYSSFGEIPQRNPSRASLALLVYQTDRRLELAWSRKDCYRSGEGSSDSNYYLQRWAGFPLRTRYRPTTNMLVLIGTMPGRQWTRSVDCDSSINSIRKAYPIKFREEFQWDDLTTSPNRRARKETTEWSELCHWYDFHRGQAAPDFRSCRSDPITAPSIGICCAHKCFSL